MGSCQVEGDPSDVSRDCGVFDVSTLGVGMDFYFADPSDLVGRRISARIPLGASLEVTFSGEIRNVRTGPTGIVRAGIEFVDLTQPERLVVDLLEHDTTVRPGAGSTS